MMTFESLKPRCIWCSKTNTNPLAYIRGIAVPEGGGGYTVRGMDRTGPTRPVMLWEASDLDGFPGIGATDVGMLLLSESTADTQGILADAGEALEVARAAVAAAMAAATIAVRHGVAAGIPEAAVARLVGVDRMTVRKMVGK